MPCPHNKIISIGYQIISSQYCFLYINCQYAQKRHIKYNGIVDIVFSACYNKGTKVNTLVRFRDQNCVSWWQST